MPHRLCIHSMLHLLAILFCLFPTIIYADHQNGQLHANYDNDQLHASHHEKGQLQIRFHPVDTDHAYVVIGDYYEYDYLEVISPRRRIVRKEKAMNAKPKDKAKSMLGNANQEFNVAKADKIFYEMVTQEGWVAENFSWKHHRFCRSFVYEFVSKLFNGECPKREEWPEEFLKPIKRNSQIGVFKPAYENARKHFTKVEDQSDCHLKEIELKIEIVGQMDPEKLPSILQIETGKVDAYGNDWERFGDDSFFTEEWIVKVDGQENEFKTKINVFVCTKEHSYFRSLKILDIKEKFELLHVFHGDLKENKVLQIDLSRAKYVQKRKANLGISF